jgi:hypothetical protein
MVSAHTDPAVTEARRRVAEESGRYRAALPKLLADPTLAGRWVLFRDGAVVASFDGGDAAHEDGLRRFGRLGGFVVARVELPRVHRIGGGFRVPDRRDDG